MIRKIAPKASNRHEYILVAIDYFTKCVEVTSYSILKAKHVARFIENNTFVDLEYHKRLSSTLVFILKGKPERS